MPAGFWSGGTGGPVVWEPRPGGEGLAAVELNDVGYWGVSVRRNDREDGRIYRLVCNGFSGLRVDSNFKIGFFSLFGGSGRIELV